MHSPTRDRCSKQTPGALDLSRLSLGCSSVYKCLSNSWMHPLLLWRSSRLTNKDVLLRGLVQDFLEVVIEVLNCITIIVRSRGVGLYNCVVKWTCPQADDHKPGRQPMTVFTMSLCTRNPTPCSCLSSLPLKYNLWRSSVDVSPVFPSYLADLRCSSGTCSSHMTILPIYLPFARFSRSRCQQWYCSWHVSCNLTEQ